MASLWLVVGGSRGFGEQLWKTLHQNPVNHLIIYARNKPAEVPESERIHFYPLDLGKLNELPAAFASSLEEVKDKSWDQITMINCAAVLGPMDRVRNFSASEFEAIQYAVNINYTSRFITTNIFLNAFEQNKNKFLVDVSSGARGSGGETWSVYCSTKAAGVIMHESIAKEEADSCRVLSYSPGILRTKMQEEISQGVDSPSKQFLNQVLSQGKEVPIQESVDYLLSILKENSFTSGDFMDIYAKRGPPLG